MIICAKYKMNPSRTVDATERTRFSKSRPNDLEDIGQGQRSAHATHPLMLLIICTKYGKNPSRTVDATERTRDAGRTDGRTEWNQYTPQQLRCVGGIMKPIYPPTTSLCGGYNDGHRKNIYLVVSIRVISKFVGMTTTYWWWIWITTIEKSIVNSLEKG